MKFGENMQHITVVWTRKHTLMEIWP